LIVVGLNLVGQERGAISSRDIVIPTLQRPYQLMVPPRHNSSIPVSMIVRLALSEKLEPIPTENDPSVIPQSKSTVLSLSK